MKPFAATIAVTSLAVTTLFATGLAAQAPTPSENTGSEASLAGGTVLNATLNSSLDSKKAKTGRTNYRAYDRGREIDRWKGDSSKGHKVDRPCYAGICADEWAGASGAGHPI